MRDTESKFVSICNSTVFCYTLFETHGCVMCVLV